MKNELILLFDTEKTIMKDVFSKYPVHEIPDHIGEEVVLLSRTLDGDDFFDAGDGIMIHNSAKVAPSAFISGPCIIDAGAEVRHCAFIRGNAVIGKGAVAGNSTEVKNAIMFDGAQAPHFNYVGDSILGHRAHLGAGAITSNLKSDGKPVVIKLSEPILTGRRKLGAFIGDGAEIGCGAVLCPGSVIGRGAVIYPLCVVRGVIGDNIIYKGTGNAVRKDIGG